MGITFDRQENYALKEKDVKIATHIKCAFRKEMVTESQNELEYSWDSFSVENIQEPSAKDIFRL